MNLNLIKKQTNKHTKKKIELFQSMQLIKNYTKNKNKF